MTGAADKPKRRPLTAARKRRCHAFHNGLCMECGEPVPVEGPDVIYDHRITFWMKPELDDDGPNLRPIHRGCDRPKTASDQGVIAKTKRQGAMRLDVPREASKNPIRSRGFQKPTIKPKWPSRPFRRKP